MPIVARVLTIWSATMIGLASAASTVAAIAVRCSRRVAGQEDGELVAAEPEDGAPFADARP